MLAAIPRLLLGWSQPVEYDGYWHVFIAQQDNWKNFWSEVYANAHPPLYFLLLKIVLWFGHSLLIYRSISLVSGVLSVFLVGWITRLVTRSVYWAYLAALAFGLALPSIIISCEVRSYMLSVFFILLSFACLLGLFPAGLRHTMQLRIGFAGGAVLACLSHYFAFFYAASALLLLAARFSYLSYKREPSSWKVEVATVVPIVGVVYALYQTHAGYYARIQMHLVPYYFVRGKERRAAFLLRNWHNFIDLFAPYPVYSNTVALGVLAISVIGGIVLLYFLLRRADASSLRAALTILITGLMLGAIVWASLAGKYPFGGELRQQYLLFPFLVVCVAICVDRLTARLPPKSHVYIAIPLAIATIWISAVRFEEHPRGSTKIGASMMSEFDQAVPEPASVYLDQFNLIVFFIFHDNWHWSTETPQPPIAGMDVYRLRSGAKTMLVFRDEMEWNAEPEDASVYRRIAACLRSEQVQSISTFTAHQSPPRNPFSDLPRLRRDILEEAAKADLCVQQLDLIESGWYATFRRSGRCSLAASPELGMPELKVQN